LKQFLITATVYSKLSYLLLPLLQH